MSRFLMLLGLLSALGLTMPLQAADKPTTPSRTIMYEDIEVFRRLLAQQFPQVQPRTGAIRSLNSVHQTPRSAYLSNAEAGALVDWADGDNILLWNAAPYLTFYPWNVNVTEAGETSALWAYTNPNAASTHVANLLVQAQPHTNINKYWTTTNVNRLTMVQSTLRVEGSYVKDLGVVYNLSMSHTDAARLQAPTKASTLSANCMHCHKSIDSKTILPPPLTKAPPKDPWEETLKDVRGVKEAPAAPAATPRMNRTDICAPGLIAENLLQAISTYGHRFRELKADEQWVFVVTVQRPPTENHTPDTNKAWKPTYDELTALAELHVKQGKHDEAIKTYQKLVDQLHQPLKLDRDTPWEAAQAMIDEATTALRGTLSKLAQLLLTANRLDEAKSVIDKAKTIKVSVADMPTKTEPTPKVTSPQKLVLTLPRKRIDDHKAGRATLEDIRKGAALEATGFEEAKGKK